MTERATEIHRVRIPGFGIAIRLLWVDDEPKVREFASMIRTEVLRRAFGGRATVIVDTIGQTPDSFWRRDCKAEIRRVRRGWLGDSMTCVVLPVATEECLDELSNDVFFFGIGIVEAYAMSGEQLSQRDTQDMLRHNEATYGTEIESVRSDIDGDWLEWRNPSRTDGFDEWLTNLAAAEGATAQFREASIEYIQKRG
jgi:hypothetical protein